MKPEEPLTPLAPPKVPLPDPKTGKPKEPPVPEKNGKRETEKAEEAVPPPPPPAEENVGEPSPALLGFGYFPVLSLLQRLPLPILVILSLVASYWILGENQWLHAVAFLALLGFHYSIKFDGKTQFFHQKRSFLTFPYRQLYNKYAGLERVEIRKLPPLFPGLVPRGKQKIFKQEFTLYEVMLTHRDDGRIPLCRLRDRAAAITAAREAAKHLGIPFKESPETGE